MVPRPGRLRSGFFATRMSLSSSRLLPTSSSRRTPEALYNSEAGHLAPRRFVVPQKLDSWWPRTCKSVPATGRLRSGSFERLPASESLSLCWPTHAVRTAKPARKAQDLQFWCARRGKTGASQLSLTPHSSPLTPSPSPYSSSSLNSVDGVDVSRSRSATGSSSASNRCIRSFSASREVWVRRTSSS